MSSTTSSIITYEKTYELAKNSVFSEVMIDEVVDSSGKTVASLKASKSFSTVLISSQDIKEGEKYTIKVGSNTTTATASKQAVNVGGGPGQGGPGGGQPGQGGPGGRQGR